MQPEENLTRCPDARLPASRAMRHEHTAEAPSLRFAMVPGGPTLLQPQVGRRLCGHAWGR